MTRLQDLLQFQEDIQLPNAAGVQGQEAGEVESFSSHVAGQDGHGYGSVRQVHHAAHRPGDAGLLRPEVLLPGVGGSKDGVVCGRGYHLYPRRTRPADHLLPGSQV